MDMQSFYARAHRAIHTPATPIAARAIVVSTTATTVSTTDLEPTDMVITPYGTAMLTAIDKLHIRICNGVRIQFYRLHLADIAIKSIVVAGCQQWSIQ